MASINASADSCSPLEVTILAIPRGVFLTPELAKNPSPLLEHAVPFEPATPSPELPALSAPVAVVEPLPVEPESEADNKIARLDTYRLSDK